MDVKFEEDDEVKIEQDTSIEPQKKDKIAKYLLVNKILVGLVVLYNVIYFLLRLLVLEKGSLALNIYSYITLGFDCLVILYFLITVVSLKAIFEKLSSKK